MKRALLYYFFLLLPVLARTQDVSVQVEYPSVVESGQQFSVTWTVNAGGGEFSAPSFEGFYKLMGPQTSYSSSTQIINGKMSHQTSYTYVYFLQAVKEGKYVISPAVFTLKNKTYQSDSMRIEVINSNTRQANVQAGGSTRQENTRIESAGGDIFIDLTLNRREVYLGEHITATVKIFTRVNLSGINEIKYPPFTGFLKADLETPPLNSLREENVNGTVYGTGVIQQFLLYPQVSGEITIEPVQITVLVQQKSRQIDPFFGDFFASYQTIPKTVVSKAAKVNVKPLPGVKPDDYSGAVGKFDLKANISKDSVNVNDAVNFKVVISGTGNLKLASAPGIKLPPDVEVYDPKITDNIKNSLNGTSGQKTSEYLLIPRHYGDFTIPSVTYSYFNTSTGKYERLTTQEFHFHARKGTEQNAGITVYGGVLKEDVKYVGKDIRFIKGDPGKLDRSSNYSILNRAFYSLYAITLFIFLLVLFVRREHIRRNADLTAVRNRKAGKIAAKRLREASACLKRGETDRFHEEILKSIWGYLSDKLNIPVSDLTRSNAVSVLKKKVIEDSVIEKLTGILDTCEFARYAPSATGTEATALYEDASQFIRTVENSIG
ncbi:MAG: BatD family protein [Bacteroidales bacterium]|jgi:hypothetical protein|nr:BatD family protein [Bacteroidales bacterium]